MHPTPSQLLIEERLGEPLAPYLRKLRTDERPWRWIARHLAEKTGYAVSAEWLRVLYARAEQGSAA